ncbi:response regulator [Plebeiibacterium sediminum]|uniref:Response regulator n=1 Tax=Plebeiibacterium sediminum TaxID=2992112 RepID=A0AAE3M1T2_9BACT|nr:response regulator [Plebeiobacterium sediminum]MCW3785170.1 response regulator [Plebeiobacterium sediminum]
MTHNNPLNILLVEDNVLNQKLIYLNLSKFNYQIDVANNGQEAVSLVMQKKFDLIIMDLMMPVMDGLEATTEIRKFEQNKGVYTHIIGLTANTFDADRDKCLKHGMDEYMAKPFDLTLFEEILHKLNLI